MHAPDEQIDDENFMKRKYDEYFESEGDEIVDNLVDVDDGSSDGSYTELIADAAKQEENAVQPSSLEPEQPLPEKEEEKSSDN